MTESPRQKPVILLVATEATRNALEDEFRSRYARDYDVRTLLGPGGCVEAVTELVTDGRRIALLGVDHALDGDALDLIDELRRLSPTSRRIVLVSSSTFREALDVLRPALAVGRLDTYLLILQGPRDEEFHTAITEYLSEWATTVSTPEIAGARIVDDGHHPAVAGIRDFFDRMGVPWTRYGPDSDVARELFAEVGDDAPLPLVSAFGRPTIAGATDRSVAAASTGRRAIWVTTTSPTS